MSLIENGYKGISFPFRFNSSGGVAISSTNPEELSHIKESIEQIIRTRKYERIMEPNFYCDVDPSLFENLDDISSQGLLAFTIREDLNRNDDRFEVEDIKFKIEEGGEKVIALVTIFVKKYLKTEIIEIPLY